MAGLVAFHSIGSHDKRGPVSGWAEMCGRLVGDGKVLFFLDVPRLH